MSNIVKKLNLEKYYFADTNFNLLMQKRIRNILLVCSEYDAFMLEEDGRIDEQIFNEYVSLNLRYPPSFIHATSGDDAIRILKSESIDLIITMLSVGDMEPFTLATEIKNKFQDIPIVVLTPFSREVSIKFTKNYHGIIDHIFCWLGNADILLAIIKLIEDKMNIEHDVFDVGVQVILLVEDSMRFYSSYLPNIYKIIFSQSKTFMSEGLNEHQKTMRMRGRPKIVHATKYEDAVELYEKYKENMLGIISDITYKKDGEIDKQAGIKFCSLVKENDPHMPFLLQSSEKDNRKHADELGVGFLDKNSKTLSIELRDYINEHFAFGDFIFRDPDNGREIARAKNLRMLQYKILEVPNIIIEDLIHKNYFTKWMKARGLFPIAEVFSQAHPEDFESIYEVKKYILDIISNYRFGKARGVIAKFDKNNFDEYLIFSRIGEGSLGGKARGLAFIDSIIKKNRLLDKYDDLLITIPRTVVLSTDIFDEFMHTNDLYDIALSDKPDDEILQAFVSSKFPAKYLEDLISFSKVVKNPIAIRSSSLLEDSHYQPFAGIYATYMIPKIESNPKLMIEQLTIAIKSVYASVFFKDSKSYMKATSNVIDEEKMGVILQEVCGKRYGNRFYPTLSGVARSINFYPVEHEKPEEGIANIAFGLGKFIVDGGTTLRFSPKYPKKIIQLSSPDIALKDTQKLFYALDLYSNSFQASVDECINILKLKINEAEKDHSLKHVASTFDFHNNIIRDGLNYKGKKIVTFASILKFGSFPLADILNDLLRISEKAFNNPVEIEFAAHIDEEIPENSIFNFLQVRPIVDNNETIDIELDKIEKEKTIVQSFSALGNGIMKNINHILYVKPEKFDPLKNHLIPAVIEKINDDFLKRGDNYILIGPGRWGSSEPTLGIPVKWPQISAARVIVESGLENYRIDPSQGTHFFQNLTSFRVGYFTINPFIKDGYFDVSYLNERHAVYEDGFVRLIKTDHHMTVYIDGKKNIGIVMKPEFFSEK